MITTLDLLNRLRVEKQLLSDRHVARFLDINHATVNKWRKGGTMSEELACEVADLLGLDVDLVLLAIIAERSKSNRVIEAVEKVIENRKIA
ncbi:hypothetical protein QTU67_001678 [Vibrio cholerae]|uniref:hypothetical protein n=1 Tax=Vibrio TaxID=662 RepID=UPI0006D84B4A|nr:MULTISPECIES: hypothetical protein [Vibrio]EGQ9634890.1 hypothetical protein [Vibrio cholerae]EGR0031257.1 hypothetical protein [Vibrio cholerae]EGR1278874.1 hypothetical protein [Vibrio cholerae]EGR5563518.1 hypothetical protein [Vibrio cholerae]EGR5571865.1 hypothetical protein [Vibrio cholerae]